MGGVSGAFLLLPFQVSVLGFTSPSASSTNLVYNVFAIPSGIYRYIREGRMAWPLAWVIIGGTLPGLFIGVIIRIKYLPDPRDFKVFIGFVLFYIGIRLLYDLISGSDKNRLITQTIENRFKEISTLNRQEQKIPSKAEGAVRTVQLSMTRCAYTFYGETFSFNTIALLSLSLAVGLIGGIYGIGGGSIIAPFLIAIFNLPVYTIAGAALLGTFLTSIFGLLFYIVIAPVYEYTGLSIVPDWKLGALLGIGGFLGVYCGARMQKYFPARAIKLLLGFVIILLSIRYVLNIF
jgi:uncharacterized membrane protein YfcA